MIDRCLISCSTLECGVKQVGQGKFGRTFTKNFHINVQIHIAVFVHIFVHSYQGFMVN
jgi:hypothetical protein